MPVRIRKTFTLFPGVKVNVNKGGMSITVGRKGFHLNFSKRGVRQTTSLAGSGISHTSYLFKDEETESEKEERSAREADDKPKRRTRKTAREQVSSPRAFSPLC